MYRPSSNIILNNQPQDVMESTNNNEIGGQTDTMRFAEHDHNAAPQVIFDHSPEVVTNGDAIDIEADLYPPSSQPEKVASKKTRIPGWLHNWKTITLIVSAIAVIIIVAVLVPITVAKSNDTSQIIPPETSYSSAVSTTRPSSLSSSRMPSATPTQSPTHDCEPSNFLPGVGWVGINNGAGWDFTLCKAESASDCCTQCYYSTPDGCNGWMYEATTGGLTPPCTMLYGYAGKNQTDECPNGHPDVVFAKDQRKPDSFGGGGPCSGAIKS